MTKEEIVRILINCEIGRGQDMTLIPDPEDCQEIMSSFVQFHCGITEGMDQHSIALNTALTLLTSGEGFEDDILLMIASELD